MPKRKELSLKMKKLIWELAAMQGKKKHAAIQRDIEEWIKNKIDDERLGREIFEDTPDVRKINKTIKEFEKYPQEVVLNLDKIFWSLRDDYDEIKQLAINQREFTQMLIRPRYKRSALFTSFFFFVIMKIG